MKALTDKIVIYKLVITYVVLFSINSLATAIVASFMNTEWSDLSATSKFILIVVILQNWSGTLLALFNKAAAEVQSGSLPIPAALAAPAPKP